MPLTIELPPGKSLLAFNRRRWAELIADKSLARLPGRIETDRYGHIIMSPPESHSNGGQQSDLAFLLKTHLRQGRTMVECPISTADGIKVADLAWISSARLEGAKKEVCLAIAPEICVEVLSPSNTKREIAEKTALYFKAGAKEVWLCSPKGRMTFFLASNEPASTASRICPPFPRQIAEEKIPASPSLRVSLQPSSVSSRAASNSRIVSSVSSPMLEMRKVLPFSLP